jgi:predicted transcriptional regulator
LCPLIKDRWLRSIDAIRQFQLHSAATGERTMDAAAHPLQCRRGLLVVVAGVDGNRDHLAPPAGMPFMLAASEAGSLQGAPLGGATMTFMEESLLTIHLDGALTQQLEAACADTGRSRGEIVRDALRRQLAMIRFEQLRRQALPFAKAAGWLTEEDVFKAVS